MSRILVRIASRYSYGVATYTLFLLVVSFPALAYAILHRRMLKRDFGYRLFPAFIVCQAGVFFILETLVLRAGWWGIFPEKTFGITLLGVPIEELVFFLLIPQVSLLVWALSRQTGSWARVKHLAGYHLRRRRRH